MQERRQYVRVNTPVVIHFPHPATRTQERSFTQDVSEAGLRFPTDVRLQVGEELALTLELPNHRDGFQATGRVVWIREISRLGAPQYDVGIRFCWIDDPDRERLAHYLNNFFQPGM